MKTWKMIVSGDRPFISRHRAMFEVMASRCNRLSFMYGDELFEIGFLNWLVKILNKLTYVASPAQAHKSKSSAQAFIARSRRIERKVRQLKNKPDYVLHLFGMYAPFWDAFDIPYGMYLDYTAALAHCRLPPSQEFTDWRNCERLAYERASHLFVMSHLVKSSLLDDYGISPEKIRVVGSFASHHTIYEGEKRFGNKQILFNGADFERKGGDIVLEAFKQVKKALPETKLVVIGKKLTRPEDGIENPGKIESLDEMRQLFWETDLVLAPGRCDPFPTFVIEGMNYGVPCIVSGNDGMPEIVDHGISGIVVDSPTPELIAEEAIALLRDIPKLTSMSQQARQKVKLQLNCNSVAEKIMQVLS